ncbi:hypothetical protein PAV_1c07220 [Paenibacillus alvei DSM 29]|nr:hypothetical protein PAV_1c07220 [Paenibacillus alvei DSM 29]
MDGSPSPKTQLHSIVKPWNGRTWILLAFLCAIHLPTLINGVASFFMRIG